MHKAPADVTYSMHKAPADVGSKKNQYTQPYIPNIKRLLS